MFLSAEVIDFHLFEPPSYVSAEEKAKFKANKQAILNDLERYLLQDKNSLNGDEIQKHLFPNEEVDVFLSHSHGDEDEVITLAILLERKGLKVFVDSCVWANAFDLLKVIDGKYCRNNDDSAYDYDKRNYSTSHVYMMLNTALHKMIDKCELFLFLGTPNSVSVNDGIKNKESLKSPWIFSELAFIQHVRRKSAFKLESITESLEQRQIIMDAQLEVHYEKPKLDFKINSRKLADFLRGPHSGTQQSLRLLYSHLNRN